MSDGASRRDRAFFGHPAGLACLLGMEVGWAFAYYGLQAMLTLYMTGSLLKPGHAEHVIGLSAYRAALEAVSGPLSVTALASQTFGIVNGLIFALPILGGLIADRWIGQRVAIGIGMVLLVLAHILFIFEPTFLISVGLMIVGTGFFKTSMLTQIGRLYAPDDDRRSRAFGIYLIALNTGSMITPLISGTLGERLGWSYGFMAMAGGMTLGALCYFAGVRTTPQNPRPAPAGEGGAKASLSRKDLTIVAVLLLLLILDSGFIGVYNQAFNILPVWTKAHVDMAVLGFRVPVTWFNTLDGLMTIVGTALAVRVWAFTTRRETNLNDVRRITIGFALTTAAFLTLSLGSTLAGTGKGPLWPEVLFFLLVDFAIPWTDTMVMTMISRDAPPSVTTTLLGVYYLAYAGGTFLTGWLGGFADHMRITAFWLMHAAIAAGALAFLVLFGGRLSRLLSPAPPVIA